MVTERRRIPTNGITLDVGLAGPADGPPVVLLHGFPEPGRCWRHQVPMLAAAGWRVIVPDQRGYAASDKPVGTRAYTIEALVDDARGLLEALGHPRATWIGHDWGGAVTWWAAQHHPEAVARFAVLNCPHPSVLARALFRDLGQLRRSWYMFLFQVPGLAERMVSKDDFRALGRSIVRTAAPGAYPEEELAAYRAAWAEPGAITGMLNWYRAGRRLLWRRDFSRIAPPALLVWGRRDHALADSLAEPSVALCAEGRVAFVDEGSHWVQNDAPGRVNTLLEDFLVKDA